MPRTIELAAILVCAAVAGGGVVCAQSVSLPHCDLALKRQEIATGKVPNFTGCRAGDAASLLRSLHLEVITPPDEAVSGIAPGIVTGQSQDDSTVALSVSTGAGYPPAPPPPPIVTVIPAPQAPVPGVPPAQQRVSFSISNAEPVEEGKAIVFRIARSGDDGQAHEIGLDYPKNANLLAEHPRTFRFEPGEPSQRDLSLNTVPGLPGGGNNDVEVALVPTKGTEIGVPRVGSGTITDVPLAPRPEKATYTLSPDGPASRGSDLTFTVTRSDTFDPGRVAYSVSQDGATLTPDTSPQLVVEFPEGIDRATLVVPAGLYERCGSPPTVTLDDGGGTRADAQFSNPPAADCGPPRRPWWIILIDWMRPNLAVVLGGIALIGGIVAHHLLKPLADVEPSLEIIPGGASFQPLEEPVSRWPKVSADILIEQGGLSVTQPLPRLETDDG